MGRSHTVSPSSGNFELSIIVPTYNEAGNMPELLRRIARVVTERDIPCEVLVMDDSSPDGTAEAAKATDVPIVVRVVERTGEKGLSPAVVEGISLARGQYILVMDADLQHPPESIPDLLEAIRADAQFVIGSRYVSGGTSDDFTFYRRVNSRAATLLSAPLIGSRVRDPMAGFFCFRRELVAGAELNPVGYKIGLEILAKCRPDNVEEVPIKFAARHAGDSKMNFGQQVDYLRHLRRLYDWRWPRASQCALFFAVGATGMVIDLTLMAMLMYSHWSFGWARGLSILAAMLFNFLLNRRVTFPDAVNGKSHTQLIRFTGVCLLGLGINWGISNALYQLLPAWQGYYVLFCMTGIVVASFSNFLLSRRIAFEATS
ncbi:MAG: glycosyltransferase [Phycisphaerae bacterium]